MKSPDATQVPHPAATKWQRKWLGLDCYCQEIQTLSERAERFCGRWFRNEPRKCLFVLVGETNCGKSHTAYAIYNFVQACAMKAFEHGMGRTWTDHVPSSMAVRWPEITDQFKAGNYSCLDDLMSSDFLVIDDIGAEHDPSKNAADKLCQVLSRREFKFTVITTNITPAQWSERFDTRIADRLLRNSDVVDLTGLESYAIINPNRP